MLLSVFFLIFEINSNKVQKEAVHSEVFPNAPPLEGKKIFLVGVYRQQNIG